MSGQDMVIDLLDRSILGYPMVDLEGCNTIHPVSVDGGLYPIHHRYTQ